MAYLVARRPSAYSERNISSFFDTFRFCVYKRPRPSFLLGAEALYRFPHNHVGRQPDLLRRDIRRAIQPRQQHIHRSVVRNDVFKQHDVNGAGYDGREIKDKPERSVTGDPLIQEIAKKHRHGHDDKQIGNKEDHRIFQRDCNDRFRTRQFRKNHLKIIQRPVCFPVHIDRLKGEQNRAEIQIYPEDQKIYDCGDEHHADKKTLFKERFFSICFL